MDDFMESVLSDLRKRREFGCLVFLAFFINDQASRLFFEIEEYCIGTPYYEGRNRFHLNQIKNELHRVEQCMNKLSARVQYEVADRLVLLEEVNKPLLDEVLEQMDQKLIALNYAELDRYLMVRIFGIMLLARLSMHTVERFQLILRKFEGKDLPVMKKVHLGQVALFCERFLMEKYGSQWYNQLVENSAALLQAIRVLSTRLPDKQRLTVLLGE